MKKYFLATGILMACLLFMSFGYTGTKKNDFTGLWDLVSVESIAGDGTITYPYGEKPSGWMMIDKDANYMLEIYLVTRKSIASSSKNTATPEENIMMVKGCNAHYGKFVADTDAKTLLYKPERAFFPNWEGQDLKSNYTYENGVLKNFSSNTTFGSAKAVVTWKKR